MRGLLSVKTFTGRKVLALLFVLCSSIPNLNPETFGETIDRVVAVVNNDIITLTELNDTVNLHLNNTLGMITLDSERINPEEVKRKTLDKLIDDKLIEQEAKKRGIVVSEEEIDHAIENMLKQSSTSRQEMIEGLKSMGLSFDEYKERMKREMEKGRFIDYEVEAGVTLNEDDIKKYYTENTDSFKVIKEVRVQHIFITAPPDAGEATVQEAYKKTRELLVRINSGEDFGKLAKIYSQGASANSGGDMGWFKRGEIIPFLERVVFNLKVGEVSDVIKSPLGLHIMKLIDRKEGRVKPLEEVKDEIREVIFAEKVEKELEELLEDLRKRSFVKIKL